MNTENHNNTIFYDGYEGEGKIILSLSAAKNTISIHVWDGYFEEIFGNPTAANDGWAGFTKDYQESVRTFDNEEYIASSTVSEYLSDLKNYENRIFSYPEAKDCLMLLIHFFEEAMSLSSAVTIKIV